jgi:hypothetical protein
MAVPRPSLSPSLRKTTRGQATAAATLYRHMAIEQYPPGIQSDDPLLADLERRLRAVLDFDLTAVEPIVAGFNNNRLLRLRADDGRQAIANAMVDLGHFAAELHAVLPSAPGADFPPVGVASFSLADKVAAIRERLRAFAQSATGADNSVAVQDMCAEVDVVTTLDRLIAAAIAGLSPAELAAVTPPEDRRLDSGDFAPHNVLVRPDGGVCVLDFENAGWDQPLALCAGFLTSATSLDLGNEQAAAFLDTYRAAIPMTEENAVRFERFCVLQHLFWCGIHLSLTTPGYLARKRFANPDLDVAAVTADQITQFRRRLVVAEAALQTLSMGSA